MNPILEAALPATLSVFATCASLAATDLVVRPSGGAGTFADVQSAIGAAQPGDRILIQPGSYPAFSITKSVTILGLGTTVDAVVVGGIHLGLGLTNQHYRVAVSRLRIEPGAHAPLAVSGQELGVGQIEFESVEIAGGFRLLAGEAGFVLSLANCSIAGAVGQGFDGATCAIAAPAPSTFALTRCRFEGAPGDFFAAQPPLAGLLLDRGVTVQIAQCEIRGGDGGIAQAGAAGLWVRNAQVRSLGSASNVRGGDGGPGASGGPGVRTTSTVFYGNATIAGGLPNGPIAAGSGTVLPSTGIDPELEVLVHQVPTGPVVVNPGTQFGWQLDAHGAPALVVLSMTIGDPQPAPFERLLIDPATGTLAGTTFQMTLPAFGGFVGLPLFGQGVSIDPAHNAVLATAPFALRLDG